jgi:Tol biopolymer transport system component
MQLIDFVRRRLHEQVTVALVAIVMAAPLGACLSTGTSPSPSSTPQGKATADPALIATISTPTTPSLLPAASPTAEQSLGNVLAYLTRDGLFLINADGTGKRKVADIPGGGAGPPVWSPDGKWIAFPSLWNIDTSRNNDIYVVRADGSALRNISNDEFENRYPQWSPDSSEILFSGGPQLMIAARDGSSVRPFFEDQDDSTHPTSPSWSPDGRHIAFQSGGGGPEHDGLYVVAMDGSGLRRLVEPDEAGRLFESEPVWSPDGRYIAFSSLQRPGRVITIVSADGSDPRDIPMAAGGSAARPAWSPDGHSIVFMQLSETGVHVDVADVDSLNPRSISPDGIAVSYFSLSPDGSLLAVLAIHDIAESGSHCSGHWEISIISFDGSSEPALTFDGECGAGPVWKP